MLQFDSKVLPVCGTVIKIILLLSKFLVLECRLKNWMDAIILLTVSCLPITELPSRDQHRRLIEQGISFVPGRAGQKCLIDDYKRIGSLWLILTCSSLYCLDDADASASRPKMEFLWGRTSLVQEEERQPEVSHYSDQEREGGLLS